MKGQPKMKLKKDKPLEKLVQESPQKKAMAVFFKRCDLTKKKNKQPIA